MPAGEEYIVVLHVGNQSFNVSPMCELKEEAEFMRDMLCIALAKIVDEESGFGPAVRKVRKLIKAREHYHKHKRGAERR